MTRLSQLLHLRSPLWRAIRLVIVLTLLWGVLTDNAGWDFGVIVIIAATWIGMMLPPARLPPWRWLEPLRFLGYFIWKSVHGGIDVASRALHPALPLQLTWVQYPLRLPPGSARTLFIAVISLLPGTLSAELVDNTVIVHALTADSGDELSALEGRIAALFSIELAAQPLKGHGHD